MRVDKPVISIGIHMDVRSYVLAKISLAIVVDPAGLKGARSDETFKICNTANARNPNNAAEVGVLLIMLISNPNDV